MVSETAALADMHTCLCDAHQPKMILNKIGLKLLHGMQAMTSKLLSLARDASGAHGAEAKQAAAGAPLKVLMH